jgi:hypothetical protein
LYCITGRPEEEDSLENTLNKIHDYREFEGPALREGIFKPDTLSHRLFRVVPIRRAPWKGFLSLHQWEIQWVTKFVQVSVTKKLFSLIAKRTSAEIRFFMSSWAIKGGCLLGELVEEFFRDFIQEKKVSGIVKNVTVDLKDWRDKNHYLAMKVDGWGPWREIDLWGPMIVVELNKSFTIPDNGYCCAVPNRSNQKMYDALIVCNDPRVPIDVLQITVLDRHSVLAHEFRKLCKKFPGRTFRFFMIRVVLKREDVESALTQPMSWSMTGPESKVGFPEVEWCELIWDFGNALTVFRNETRQRSVWIL